MSYLRRLVPMMLGLALVGCGGGGSEPRDLPFEGTYKLVRMNGAPMPYTMSMNGATVRVNSGLLDLEHDSTYTLSAVAFASFMGQTGEVPFLSAGTYVRSGNNISFPFMLEGMEYNVSGTVKSGVLKLTTAEAASPIRSMELRRISD